MIEAQEPVQLMAEVIREAVTCERTECTPEQHVQFVEDNMRISTKEIGQTR
ncbi:hypothetical protein [Streptomyces sp. NPDC091217]|uniref:hypothetical protein n=1 Tax=Streptomyces sp. NPDC091217 TaxID=3365975 RepID=UPI00381A12CE